MVFNMSQFNVPETHLTTVLMISQRHRLKVNAVKSEKKQKNKTILASLSRSESLQALKKQACLL